MDFTTMVAKGSRACLERDKEDVSRRERNETANLITGLERSFYDLYQRVKTRHTRCHRDPVSRRDEHVPVGKGIGVIDTDTTTIRVLLMDKVEQKPVMFPQAEKYPPQAIYARVHIDEFNLGVDGISLEAQGLDGDSYVYEEIERVDPEALKSESEDSIHTLEAGQDWLETLRNVHTIALEPQRNEVIAAKVPARTS